MKVGNGQLRRTPTSTEDNLVGFKPGRLEFGKAAFPIEKEGLQVCPPAQSRVGDRKRRRVNLRRRRHARSELNPGGAAPFGLNLLRLELARSFEWNRVAQGVGPLRDKSGICGSPPFGFELARDKK